MARRVSYIDGARIKRETTVGLCRVGWALSPIGRLDGLDLEALITMVSRQAIGRASNRPWPNLRLGGVLNRGVSSVARYVIVLKGVR